MGRFFVVHLFFSLNQSDKKSFPGVASLTGLAAQEAKEASASNR
jgi:hypothetical protein